MNVQRKELKFCDSLRDNSKKPYSKFDNTSQPILDIVRETILVCFNLITKLVLLLLMLLLGSQAGPGYATIWKPDRPRVCYYLGRPKIAGEKIVVKLYIPNFSARCNLLDHSTLD